MSVPKVILLNRKQVRQFALEMAKHRGAQVHPRWWRLLPQV